MFSRENAFPVRDMLDNFGDILPETSIGNACWDMCGNSHLTWLSSNSLYLELKSITCRILLERTLV